MLKVLGLVFKITLFAALVLVLGQMIHWRGRTLSDQVKTTLSSAEKSPSLKKVKKTSTSLLDDAREAIREQTRNFTSSGDSAEKKSGKTEKASRGNGSPVSEGILREEREELNAVLDL